MFKTLNHSEVFMNKSLNDSFTIMIYSGSKRATVCFSATRSFGFVWNCCIIFDGSDLGILCLKYKFLHMNVLFIELSQIRSKITSVILSLLLWFRCYSVPSICVNTYISFLKRFALIKICCISNWTTQTFLWNLCHLGNQYSSTKGCRDQTFLHFPLSLWALTFLRCLRRIK